MTHVFVLDDLDVFGLSKELVLTIANHTVQEVTQVTQVTFMEPMPRQPYSCIVLKTFSDKKHLELSRHVSNGLQQFHRFHGLAASCC